MERPARVALSEGANAGALRKTAVSHVGFSVPDVHAAERFYTRVLGLHRHSGPDDDRVRLGWGSGHHVVELREGEKGLTHFGFEVRDADGLERARARLDAAGVAHSPLPVEYVDEATDAPSGLVFADPDGNTVHLHGEVRRQGENSADTGRRPIKFQHITVGTADVPRLVAFYVDVLGFRISDQLRDGNFAWLRSDRDHHTLAIVNVGRGGDIDHYSYDLAEWEDFKAWCDRLTELAVPVSWGPGRHGPGNNLFVFFDDPAGNHIELSAEMEKFHDDRVEYAPRRWTPSPQTVNLWGGQKPTWRRLSERDD